jgi:hypothetical protein
VIYPDNASQKPSVSDVNYNDGNIEIAYNGKTAVRFTPSSYPAHLDAAKIFFYNPTSSTADVDIVVYANDASGFPGGTQLFRKTLTYVPTGWVIVGISGVVINTGDFFIAVEQSDTTISIVQDDTGVGRSYYNGESGWALDVGFTTYISAIVRGADSSTQFDRVNNVLGLTIDNPVPGNYTIKVSGYNVPQGPQPYSLVVSGEIDTKVNLPWLPLLLLDN